MPAIIGILLRLVLLPILLVAKLLTAVLVILPKLLVGLIKVVVTAIAIVAKVAFALITPLRLVTKRVVSIPPRHPKLTFKVGLAFILAALGYLVHPLASLFIVGFLGMVFFDIAMLKLFGVRPLVASGRAGARLGIARGLFIVAGAAIGWAFFGTPGSVGGALAGVTVLALTNLALGSAESSILG